MFVFVLFLLVLQDLEPAEVSIFYLILCPPFHVGLNVVPILPMGPQ